MEDLDKLRDEVERSRGAYIHFARLVLTPDQAIELIDRVKASETRVHDELLTLEERVIVGTLANLAGQIYQVIRDGAPIGPHDDWTRSMTADWAEAAFHIHGLQRMMLAQAAARAYPQMYRAIGDEMPAKRPPPDSSDPF